MFREAKDRAGKKPKTLISDGAANLHRAFNKEYYTMKNPQSQHVQDIRLSGQVHNNKMERQNGETRDREKVMRGLKREDSPILKGMQIHHNFIRPHMGLNGKTPAKAAGIRVEGENRWLMIIQTLEPNTSTRMRPNGLSLGEAGAAVILLGVLLDASVVPITTSAAASPPSITISISPSYPLAPYNFTIYGNVTVGSGSVSATSVALKILASNGSLVESAMPPVIGTGASGTYSQNFTTAPATVWAGSYIARATYAFEGATASASLNFTVAVCVCGPAPITVTATTPPTLVDLSLPTVSQGFASRYPSALSVYMWVSVLDPSGQTVGVYIGSAVLETNVSTTVQAALFNLPSGSYTAVVFLTTVSGVVVSQTSTMPPFTI